MIIKASTIATRVSGACLLVLCEEDTILSQPEHACMPLVWQAVRSLIKAQAEAINLTWHRGGGGQQEQLVHDINSQQRNE